VIVSKRSELDKRMNEEFAFHIEQRAKDLEQTGLSRDAALRQARLEFGGTDKYKEKARGVWFVRGWHDFLADVRFGLRVLAKSPAFTLAAVLTLALAIGVNSAVFSAVYGILYRPLPFRNADRVAMIYLHFSPQNNPRGTLSLADFLDIRDSSKSFEKVAAATSGRADLRGGEEPEQVASASVTADFFSVLGLEPLRGRTFRAGEDTGSAPNLVVISESLWERRFHRDESVIGRVIEVNGRPATIIGVVTSSYGVPRGNPELWENVHVAPTRRGPFFYRGIGRLREGVSFEQAQAEMTTLADNLNHGTPRFYRDLQIPIEPLRNALTFAVRPALLMMFGAVLIVMLIAIVNIANLLLSRASVRQPEIAIRTSLGAGRARLVQQMLTESVLLALFGASVGLVLAYWAIHVFKTADLGIPLMYTVQLDWRVVAFTMLLSLMTAIAFGLVPALQASRPQATALRAAMGSGGQRHLGHSFLVIGELALCLVLLVGAGLLLRSFMRLQQVETGATAPETSVLTMQVSPKPIATKDPNAAAAASIAFYRSVVDRLQTMPQLRTVAVSDSVPPQFSAEDDSFNIAGIPWSAKDFPSTSLPRVSAGYFKALGIPVLRGRAFDERDVENSPPVVIISKALAKRYFGDQDPLGHRLKQSGPENDAPFMEIVGVVDDVKYWGLNGNSDMAYYMPYTQNAAPVMHVIVRTDGPAARVAQDVQAAIREVDAEAVVRRVLTLEDLVNESTAQPRFRTTLLGSFAALALLLAAIGTYGVIAYNVTQRTREFGIRLALGSPRSKVLTLVMSHGFRLTAFGLVIGLVASVAVSRVLTAFLFGVAPHDPFATAGAALLLIAVAGFATLLPAIRAVRIDPLQAIRYE
jgi:putative ABC transport system permease protein